MKNRRDHPFRHKGKQSPAANPAISAPAPPAPMSPLLQQAMAHHRAGQLAEAEALYRQVLDVTSNHPDALHLLGVIASQVGNGALAVELIDRAIQARPKFAEAYCSRANALYLLGQHQAAAESYDKAIRLKADFAEACCNRANTLQILKRYQAALESSDQAIHLKPDFAEAHNNRGNALHAMQQYLPALESYDQAIRLKPDFAEAHNNRGNALHALVQYQAAIASFDKALERNPDYADARSNRDNSIQALERFILLKPDYDYARETEAFAAAVREVARIAKLKGKAAIRAALDALPPDLRFHPVLCNLASVTFPKTESSGRDLVFYCAPTRETWNPRTAEAKGIGGSEEAVIWLSRLLHRRGWNVTVYASCGLHAEDYDGVRWSPYWMWNYRDRQDVTIVWRHPQFTSFEINSGAVVVDLHDVIPEDVFTPERLARTHRIFVKSTFHRSLYPNIADDKFVILANGIDAKLFAGAANRDPLLLINTSSADRSMEAFLDCFAEIKQQVPAARAQWAYGWGVWDAAFSQDPPRLQWKAKMQRRMAELGVEELGRVSHSDIAALYHRANIFFYPSEMAEIDCISISKAMAAGAIPITTDFAALGDKAGHGGVFIHSKKTKDDWAQPYQFHFEITGPEQKSRSIEEAVKLLRNPTSEQERGPMRQWARAEFDWERVAGAWHEVLASLAAPPAMPPTEDADRVLQRAMAHHQAGELAQAEALYRQVLAASPHNLGALHLLGVIACQAGQPALALDWIDRAIQIDPNFADAYINRGGALHTLGQYQAAVESYDTAIRLNPANADSHYNRGNALHALEQFQAAVENFDRAVQLKPATSQTPGTIAATRCSRSASSRRPPPATTRPSSSTRGTRKPSTTAAARSTSCNSIPRPSRVTIRLSRSTRATRTPGTIVAPRCTPCSTTKPPSPATTRPSGSIPTTPTPTTTAATRCSR
jgi:tetratricopeptide (TPR) repeat protein